VQVQVQAQVQAQVQVQRELQVRVRERVREREQERVREQPQPLWVVEEPTQGVRLFLLLALLPLRSSSSLQTPCALNPPNGRWSFGVQQHSWELEEKQTL
jgi:hypothetical protein